VEEIPNPSSDGLPTKRDGSPPRPGFSIVRVVLVIAVLGLFAFLLRKMDLATVWRTLRAADWRLILAAVVLNVALNTSARIQRWRILLEPLPHPGPRIGFWRLGSLLVASYAANNLLPARSGEILRTIGLHRSAGYPVGALIACQLVEKLVEALSVGLLAVPILLLGRPSTPLAVPLTVAAAVSVAAIVLLFFLSNRTRAAPPPMAAGGPAAPPGRWWRRFIARIIEAIRLMGTLRTWSRALMWSWVSDLADVAMIALCLEAVHIKPSLSACFLVFVGVNLAIAVPSTPAQVGAFEAGAVLVLGTLGIAHSQALSFALLYHTVHIVPTTLMGAIPLVGQWRSRRSGINVS
jgi:uncharacterized membrane protein YbhN (UPF0104 family)